MKENGVDYFFIPVVDRVADIIRSFEAGNLQNIYSFWNTSPKKGMLLQELFR